jgi:hypothetical protein
MPIGRAMKQSAIGRLASQPWKDKIHTQEFYLINNQPSEADPQDVGNA